MMKHNQLFNAITGVLPTLDGWCELEKAHALAAAVLTLRPEVVVEIGVFGGRSLIPMAMACQAVGRGKVVGIDPWAAAASVESQDEANRQWWQSCDHERVYQGFLRQVAQLGLQGHVEVRRAKSDDVAPPETIDLLHVDGNHGDPAYRDVRRFGPKVRVGGLAVLDDIGWTGGAVQRGVEFLLSQGFVELYRLGTGALFQRVR